MRHDSFLRTDHRPWPIPKGPWLMRQSWADVLFAHWPVPESALRHLVPPELTIQEFDGTSWVGAVPFRMEGVSPRFCPDIPGFSAFPEVNLRLYVELDGKPGVWFLSLDATNSFAVWGGRRLFFLPYFKSVMQVSDSQGMIDYRSRRAGSDEAGRFEAVYRPKGAVYETSPGSLEHWLTERYCLYAQPPGGRLTRTEVHHIPWPLQNVDAEITHNTLASGHGFVLEQPPALVHFSRRVDVVAWIPRRI